jgi:hypothetical protein
MSRPRVALILAAVLVAFGIFVGLAPYFEVDDSWRVSFSIFALAAFPVAYAALDKLLSSYRRRRLRGQALAASSSIEGTSPQRSSSR